DSLIGIDHLRKNTLSPEGIELLLSHVSRYRKGQITEQELKNQIAEITKIGRNQLQPLMESKKLERLFLLLSHHTQKGTKPSEKSLFNQESFSQALEAAKRLARDGTKTVICEHADGFTAIAADSVGKLTPLTRQRLEEMAEHWEEGKPLVSAGERYVLSSKEGAEYFYASQLKWNAAEPGARDLLTETGDCCLLATGNPHEYRLFVRSEKEQLEYTVRAHSKGIDVSGPGGDRTVDRFHELIEDASFPARVLKTGREAPQLPEELYYRILLPTIRQNGAWVKVSKRDYPDILKRSLWISGKGEIYQQYYKVAGVADDIAKHKLGEGGWKIVWALEPHAASSSDRPMARARVKSQGSMETVDRDLMIQLEGELGHSPYHLLPHTISYKDQLGMVMPFATGGTLKDAYVQLTPLGRLRAARDILYGLRDAEAAQWLYFDMKGENVLLLTKDPNNPEARIADHDLCRKDTDPTVATSKTFGSREIKFPKYARLDTIADPEEKKYTTKDAHEGHLWCWACTFAELEKGGRRPPWFDRTKDGVYEGEMLTPQGVATEQIFADRDKTGWGDEDSFLRILWDCLLIETPDAPHVQPVTIASVVERIETLIAEAEAKGISAE
ncbi:MAG: hypothetical protein ACE5GN_07045, partial [Waddliaceae bacterium]